mmetsp:Transcript_27553/g.26600  ORF Transcript_27553/g.26600 Transcript_27553/m.26600 type:complete len:80 (+) Transcript_27553:627-866(+)
MDIFDYLALDRHLRFGNVIFGIKTRDFQVEFFIVLKLLAIQINPKQQQPGILSSYAIVLCEAFVDTYLYLFKEIGVFSE